MREEYRVMYSGKTGKNQRRLELESHRRFVRMELREGKGRQTVSDALSGNVPSHEPNTNGFESAEGKAGLAGREACRQGGDRNI